jgi:uncharacterized protein YegL
MQKDYTHIVIVLDKSGSMAPRAKEVIQEFNKFIEEQKKLPGRATLTLVQFNHNYEVSHTLVDVQTAPELTADSYRPTGWTALLDALGWAIDATGQGLSLMKEEDRPDKVIFCIITDGEENRSKEYRYSQVREKITIQNRDYNWQFIFIGAGVDTFNVAERNLGISMHISVDADARGIAKGLREMTNSIGTYRTGGDDALRANYIKPKI